MAVSKDRRELVEGSQLAHLAEVLERTGLAAEIYEPDWTLVWVSSELKALLGEADIEAHGLGVHMLEGRQNELWRRTVTPDGQGRWIRDNLPYVAYDTPGGIEALQGMAGPDDLDLLEGLEPASPPPMWASSFEFIQGELPPVEVGYLAIRNHDLDGASLGTTYVYSSRLPATILALVARGDVGMFGRMAALFEPGRRSAAVLFADLEASGTLSRRLPSAAYFRLIRAITTAIDEVVVSHHGIVSKHAGDGVTAFFLSQDAGSNSAAARAAVASACEMSEAVAAAAADMASEGAPVDPADCALNVAAHWGGALYMGQLVTGGRLEVTALGDEVNECARIEQSARGGQLLASKALLERLEEPDAEALGIDPDRVAYRTVAELPDASDKAVRDAGGIAVTELGAPREARDEGGSADPRQPDARPSSPSRNSLRSRPPV